jgi:hypothetical protein
MSKAKEEGKRIKKKTFNNRVNSGSSTHICSYKVVTITRPLPTAGRQVTESTYKGLRLKIEQKIDKSITR